MPASSFRQLRVWQDAMVLTTNIYRATSQFPKQELYGYLSRFGARQFRCPAILPKGRDAIRIGISYDSCWLRVGHFWNWKRSC